MRAHGITPTTAAVKPMSSRTPKTERRDSKSQIHKKRKTSAFVEENTAADDEESFSAVKPDPACDKEQLNVKEEAVQLSIDEATNLMQYYNAPSYDSQIGGNDVYSQTAYDSGPSSYHAGVTTPYGLQEQQPYDFSFASTSMNNGSATLDHGLQYQPMMHFSSTDSQGGSESPLVVD